MTKTIAKKGMMPRIGAGQKSRLARKPAKLMPIDQLAIVDAACAVEAAAKASLPKIQARLLASALSANSMLELLDEAAKLVESVAPGAVCLIDLGGGKTNHRFKCKRLAPDADLANFAIDAEPPTALAFVQQTGEMLHQSAIARSDILVEHGLRALAAGFASYVALPLLPEGQSVPIGALAVYFQRERGPSPEFIAQLEGFCGLLAQFPAIVTSREKVRRADDRFAELASTIPGVVYQRVVRPDGDIRYSYISEGSKDLFGVDAATVIRDPEALFAHYSPEYRMSFRQKLIKASEEMATWDVEAQIVRPDGTRRYTHAIAHPRREPDGSVVWTGVILDATRMKLAEMEAAAAESRTREAIVESFSQGLLLFDQDNRLIVRNSKFLKLNPGMEAIAVPGASYVDVLQAELDPKRPGQITSSDTAHEFSERLAKHMRKVGVVFERRIADDRWILINDNPVAEGGKVVLYTDVTELKRRELHIEHIAHHDSLTGLPNRVLFRKRLETVLMQGAQNASDVAVVFIDLDRFKAVNDTLGHPVGDALLQVVGQRIQECLRLSDIAARLGGDEFAIIVSQNVTTDALTSLAWRLIDVLSRPTCINGHSVIVGASIGIAIGHDDADNLLKSADLAVYRAKSDGKGTFRFFENQMDAVAQERRLLEMDLREAIRTEQFEVHYQPQVDVFSAQMVGAEALIRWTHPVRGKVPPAEFIPLAEETGLIAEIGPWVLRRACRDAASWPLATRVSVNCSPAQFQNGGFVDVVRSVLEETGLAPSRLEIEITESLLIRDTDANLRTLWGLKELGVRVSMDDFGTGYSSLGNLRSFPFDKIKIDRSFIHDLKNNVDAAAIIRAVVSLGRSLGITTTAEGVETRDQLTYLRAEGCSEVQGFYYSEAIPSNDIRAMLINSPNGVLHPR